MNKNRFTQLLIVGGLIYSLEHLYRNIDTNRVSVKDDYDKKINEYKIIKKIINDFN